MHIIERLRSRTRIRELLFLKSGLGAILVDPENMGVSVGIEQKACLFYKRVRILCIYWSKFSIFHKPIYRFIC